MSPVKASASRGAVRLTATLLDIWRSFCGSLFDPLQQVYALFIHHTKKPAIGCTRHPSSTKILRGTKRRQTDTSTPHRGCLRGHLLDQNHQQPPGITTDIRMAGIGIRF